MTRLIEPSVREGASYRVVLGVVAGSTFLTMLAYAGPLGNVVTVTRALGASQAGTTWMLASMSAGLAVTLLATGVVADRVGQQRVFCVGAIVFALANAVCMVAQSAPVFIAARAVAGLGAAGIIATGLGLVTAVSTTPRQHSTTATWWSVAMGAGIALGPLLTGAMDLVDAWRWFYALLAVGGLVLYVGTCRMPLPHNVSQAPPRRLDVLGFVLLTGFLTVLVAAIVEVRAGVGVHSLTLFATALALLVALAVSQFVGERRLIDPRLFTHLPFLGATAAGFGTGIGVIAVMSFACSYFVNGLGRSTLEAGAILAAWSGTSSVAALLFARTMRRTSGTTQLMSGLGGVALGLALMSGIGEASGQPWPWSGLVVAGIATGLLNTGLARQAVATVPADSTATGTAANNTARYLGAAIGVSAASIIATHGDPSTGWTRVAWSGAAVSLGFAALVGLLALWAWSSRREIAAVRTPEV